jgi:hypothetical protein
MNLRRPLAFVVMSTVAVVLTACSTSNARPSSASGAAIDAGTTSSPRTPPTHLAAFASSGFVQPFSATIPAWAASTTPTTAVTGRLITWEQTPCTNDCTNGTDVKLRVLAPQSVVKPKTDVSVPLPDYAGYLTYLASLERSGAVVVSDKSGRAVDGHPATVLSVTAPSTIEGAIACELAPPATNGCWGFIADFRLRLAVIDVGKHPLLVWVRTNASSTQAAASDADLDAMLASMSFHSEPSRSSSGAPAAGLEGTWRTAFTRADAVKVLTGAGLDKHADTVLSEFPDSTSAMRWELRIGGGRYGIWRINPDGTTTAEDGQPYELNGTTLTADPTNANGTKTVYTVALTGSVMTWTFVSDVSPPLAPGVPDEAIQRVLYTTGVWKRVS